MAQSLDILAIEPYFGGLRRDMLRTLSRCSRHSWRILKLPPRAMKRRLTTSAHWFAGKLAADPEAPMPDVLFTSDALNLTDLHRLNRRLARRPSVVYFHCNDLPDPAGPVPKNCFDLPHLVSARAATEIWFNSPGHAGSFISAVDSMYESVDELKHPGQTLRAKLHVVPPPIEEDEEPSDGSVERCPDTIFVDLAGANLELLGNALELLGKSNLKWKLITAGNTPLPTSAPREAIGVDDPAARAVALRKASIFVSARIAAPIDEAAILALRAGCQPVVPHTGVYPDLLTDSLHDRCLYDMSAESLAAHIRQMLLVPRQISPVTLSAKLAEYDVAAACLKIDERLDEVAANFQERRRSTAKV